MSVDPAGGRPSGRVEFVEPAEVGPAATDEVVTGSGAPRSRRTTVLLAAGAAVIVLAAVLVGVVREGAGGPPAATGTGVPSATALRRPSATPTGPPVFGLIGLPRAIGEPGALVAAGHGDTVWMLDRGAGVVRIDGGRVTHVQLLEAQATAIAVDPAGNRLYVATTGDAPALHELDAATLALGPSVPTERTVQSLAVSSDAVWAAVSGALLRLDLSGLATLATVDLPGAVITASLRIGQDPSGAGEVLTGLVTGTGDTDGAGDTVLTRPVRLDPLTGGVGYGAGHPGEVQLANSAYLSWVSWTDPDRSAPTTQGYTAVTDTAVAASATPALEAGSRIFDGGPGRDGFLVVAPDSSVIGCRDGSGFRLTEVDVDPALPGALITGPVLRTDTAFYAATDRGLVRAGVGACV